MEDRMPLDPEDELTREVFAHYGLVLYLAQCLEKGICIALSGPFSPIPEAMTTWRFQDLLDGNFPLTFGQLVKDLSEMVTMDSQTEEKLKRAVELRNWLAHDFWWERVVEFQTTPGQERLLAELVEYEGLFSELDAVFSAVSQKWLSERGLPVGWLEAEMARWATLDATPPRDGRRRLRKRETLVSVYLYDHIDKDGEKVVPIFELADHSLWSLCECGLSYGPPEVDRSCLRFVSKLQKVLPAEIDPRPNDAKKWDYRFHLSTDYDLAIWVAEEGGRKWLRWALHRSR